MAEWSPPEARRRAVVDTNVLAFYLLEVAPYHEEAAVCLAAPIELMAPASWRPEILHVLWQAVRSGAIGFETGLELLEEAENLIDLSLPVESLWREALSLAAHRNCNSYDALFVALAQREGVGLLTFDGGLLRTFPETARRPRAEFREP